MTVLEVIERCNYTGPSKRIMAYIQDALNEIQTLSEDQVSREFLNIEEDVRYYNLPTSMVKLEGVFGKSGTDWIRIPRIQRNDILEDSGESTSTSDDSIIIV